MAEALRIAQEAERAEEEELMRRAIEESQKLEEQAKHEEDEEAEMIRKAIELSQAEEQARKEAGDHVEEPDPQSMPPPMRHGGGITQPEKTDEEPANVPEKPYES